MPRRPFVHTAIAVCLASPWGASSSVAFITASIPPNSNRLNMNRSDLNGASLSLHQKTSSRGGALMSSGPQEGAKDGAVVVGGGPTGMATALMLAKRGWTGITVLERNPSASYFDPNVAFVYQIDARGQLFTNDHDLTEKLASCAVDSRDFALTKVPPTGARETLKLPIIDKERKTAYWLPRSVFQSILYEEVESKYPGQVKVLFSTSFEGMQRLPGGGFELTAQAAGAGAGEGGGGEVMTFRPRLVVGADGLNSRVSEMGLDRGG
ncbi:unnamed protein product [Discosporangium mesarthrocarpum]